MKKNFILLSAVLLMCVFSFVYLVYRVLVGLSPWWVICLWLAPVCLALLAILIPTETQVCTSKQRTEELLNIHASIGPKIPFKRDTDKIIMFSDLHRGMGEKDVFQNNKELFTHILKDYYDNGFTLVLIGDAEEGWGFQRDNIPLIMDAHADEVDIEKKFRADNRYYRVYGNHDDFFRGHYISFGDTNRERVYPAITFCDTDKSFTIFITHGCQGQGLHDAGDNLASWGVYAKYSYFLEVFPQKLKSHKELIEKMETIERETEGHEDMVYNWALNADGEKKCNILVAGHTHIPVFNSKPREHLYDAILDDLKTGKYIFFNDIFETGPATDTRELPCSLKDKIRQKIEGKKNAIRCNENSTSNGRPDPFYFNTGCGFHSKITCIEISEGKIYLKLLSTAGNETGFKSEIVESAELKNY